MAKYIPTGNEMVSLPTINERNASIESVNFLHMGYKGLVEICGADGENPFMQPFIRLNGIESSIQANQWERINYWVPSFKAASEDTEITGIILAPVGERGFIYRLEIVNKSKDRIDAELGIRGCWKDTLHTVNESKPVNGTKHVYASGWNNSLVCDLRSTVTVFSLAPIYEAEMNVEQFMLENNEVKYKISKKMTLEPGEIGNAVFYWGIGLEEVSAATSAKEMMRKGFEKEMAQTVQWLSERQRTGIDDKLDKTFNTNLFFNYFYASGITLDTEEFVLVTSRSPRYYVSAAYWDRDSLLWSFPSILITDRTYARNMLEYVFTKQIKNVGVHSRYIDGVLLEPGFELDELCAPVIALNNYVNYTGDTEILKESFITKGVDKILNVLETKKHKHIDLYETFLQPTDDVVLYPYLTYDNVLVWKLFTCVSQLFRDTRGEEFCSRLMEQAQRIERAIWDNCVFETQGKKIFAWSVDLEGNWNVYDEPPGSLQLLPFYGFCESSDEVYRNTVDFIRRPEYEFSFSGCSIPDIGCEHAPHPWVLSIANSLISGRRKEFMEILPRLKMDNGIACESVDENTGECTTGEAFATCAGFLAYSIYKAFYER